jgi:hypothetical protein
VSFPALISNFEIKFMSTEEFTGGRTYKASENRVVKTNGRGR